MYIHVVVGNKLYMYKYYKNKLNATPLSFKYNWKIQGDYELYWWNDWSLMGIIWAIFMTITSLKIINLHLSKKVCFAYKLLTKVLLSTDKRR